MPRAVGKCIQYEVVELDGVRYAILRETVLQSVCRQAGVQITPPGEPAGSQAETVELERLDVQALAERLIARRKRAGLSQAQLARRAGIRVETLNRIERGRVTPDFSTIRKLLISIKAAEAES